MNPNNPWQRKDLMPKAVDKKLLLWQVADLREKGWTDLDKIATHLDATLAQVRTAWRTLDKRYEGYAQANIEILRGRQLAAIDNMLRTAVPAAERFGLDQHRYIDNVTKLLERQAKLMGLDLAGAKQQSGINITQNNTVINQTDVEAKINELANVFDELAAASAPRLPAGDAIEGEYVESTVSNNDSREHLDS